MRADAESQNSEKVRLRGGENGIWPGHAVIFQNWKRQARANNRRSNFNNTLGSTNFDAPGRGVQGSLFSPLFLHVSSFSFFYHTVGFLFMLGKPTALFVRTRRSCRRTSDRHLCSSTHGERPDSFICRFEQSGPLHPIVDTVGPGFRVIVFGQLQICQRFIGAEFFLIFMGADRVRSVIEALTSTVSRLPPASMLS